MSDDFLEYAKVRNEEGAMREALNAALQQRQNKVYARDEMGSERETFRFHFAKLIGEQAKAYFNPTQPVSDDQHYEAIRRISDTLSARFGTILQNQRLRYGTAQKALNLYLKFLWRLGKIPTPPHCPIDGKVLAAAGISGSWTSCDDEREYALWINQLKKLAAPRSLSEWEYKAWNLATDTSS